MLAFYTYVYFTNLIEFNISMVMLRGGNVCLYVFCITFNLTWFGPVANEAYNMTGKRKCLFAYGIHVI